jgi:hypothetical protein
MPQRLVLEQFLAKAGCWWHILVRSLRGSKLNYSTYDVDFYALIQALKHWSTYLAYSEFILHMYHEALKHLQIQDKLSSRHAG